MTKKKCVIIGSGLGGLSCGLILAKNDYDVTILEQGAQIGGCLQCFYRQGVKFETGMHFIGSADKGQTLSRLSNYLGISKDIKLSRLDTTGYHVVSLHDQLYKFANGKEAFIEQMCSYFPDESQELENYYDIIEKIASASSLHSLEQSESNFTRFNEYQTRSINDVLHQFIHNPLLRDVLVGYLPLYAPKLNKTPFSAHAFITDFYNKSAFRVVGGSDYIAKSLNKSLVASGGRVLTRKQVTHIDCNDVCATGVTTKDGEHFEADIVISDVHPARTLEMLDTKMIRPIFRNRINSIPNTTACFSIYLHFKKDKVPYMNYNFFGYKQGPWDCERYDSQSWPKGYLYMHFCHCENPTFAESGVIISYMSFDDVREWEKTTIGNRGPSYEEFKEQKAQTLLAAVKHDFPNITSDIESYYTSTPLTYQNYTGTQDGSMYGIEKSITQDASCRVPFRTKVPNLFFAGQNVNSHGMLGVLVGTMVVCSYLIGEEYLFRQIKEANNE